MTSDIPVFTRASRSLFREYQEAPSPARAWLANNLLGRSIFLGNRLYTPQHGAVSVPWWAPAEKVVEERVVNADRFSPEAEPREDLFNQSRRRVVTVGRISRQKGTDLLLDVADRLGDHEFALVGPVGDESLAVEADAIPNVTRHPPVEYVEMPGVYAAADVALSASRIEWGGVSRAMMEGAAVGLPVIALDQEEASSVADVTVPADPGAIATAITDFTAP
ncbi:MAG: glycosyltransferase [Halorhabdus sp.]